jgi:aquaporin Z
MYIYNSMASPDKYLAEFLGTMLLLVGILASSGNPLVVGGALAAAVYFSASISGGHINPAVSLAMYVNKKLSLKDLLMYVTVQLAGGVSAVFLYNAVVKL